MTFLDEIKAHRCILGFHKWEDKQRIQECMINCGMGKMIDMLQQCEYCGKYKVRTYIV